MELQTEQRVSMLREKMVQQYIDLVALGPGSHMEWLVGFHPHPDERPCLLLVSLTGIAFLMPALNAEGARVKTDLPFYCWADETGPDIALDTALDYLKAKKAEHLVLDETMRADFALLIMDALPELTRREFTDRSIGDLRLHKDERECALLKQSALIADGAIQAAYEAAKPGMTENQLADVIKNYFASQGATPDFWIVGAGEDGAYPHHTASDRVIQEGDAIVVDIGATKQGYPSDITRMIVIGDPDSEYGTVNHVVERAVQAALKACKPGVKASEVDAAARDVIKLAGYGQYFNHRTGHGLGIDGHEPPYLTQTSDVILQEGMVFSIEPGIYLPGRFGVRLEEIVIMRADGPEILSELPRETHKVAPYEYA